MTAAQRGIVEKMRDGWALVLGEMLLGAIVYLEATGSVREAVTREDFDALGAVGLLSTVHSGHVSTYYELTELGRTIDLTK